MSDYAPVVDQFGIHAKDFRTVLGLLSARFRDIYGQDIYIEPDSQDGQLIGILALALADLNAAAVALYNAFSPATAQGNGLSSVVKINGIRRKLPSHSTCDVRIDGQAGAVIRNGAVGDGSTKWLLPDVVTIPTPDAFVIVTATCETEGAIKATAGTLTQIMTPVLGWQSVTNPAAAVEGAAVESDGALRIRQTVSVATPSQSIFEGISANVWAVRDVKRVGAYENPTNEYDANGLPPHSICLVVEGGDAEEIGQSILLRKNPGCDSIPSKATPVSPEDVRLRLLDTTNDYRDINFYRPKYVRVSVNIVINAGRAWSLAVAGEVRNAVSSYINALPIGADVSFFRVMSPLNFCNKRFLDAYDIIEMTISGGATDGHGGVIIGFREAAICVPTDVQIIVNIP